MDVRMPDGTIIRGIPEGTPKEEVMARYQARQARRGDPEERLQALYKGGAVPPERNYISSALHGGIDTAGAVAQLASRGATALGLPPGTDAPFIASPEVVEQGIGRAREQVNQRFGEPNAGGLDIVRWASSAALSAPYMGSVGTAPTMIGRGAQAVRAGAIGGALQPVAPDKQDEFWKQKAFQSGSGAAIGGVAQPALEGLGAGVQKIAESVARRGKGVLSNASDEAAYRIAYQAAAQQGIKFNEMSKEVQQSLVAEVKEALKKYGGVNSAAVARQADFKALDIDPLQPWVTRDPVQWGQYKNLEGARDAGEPLIQKRAELDRKLVDRLSSLRGKPTGDQYQSGTIAERALTKHQEQAEAAIKANYDKFAALAPNATADGTRLTSELFKSLDEKMAGGFLSEQLRGTLNDVALGKIPASPQVLYQLQKIANREARKGGNEGFAAGQVSKAIDDELDRFSNEFSIVGPEMRNAFEALKAGRSAHRNFMMEQEAVPALKAVADGRFAAEDFFDRYIKSADVRQVASMWAKIKDDDLKQAARSQLVDFLKKSASGSGSDDSAVFRQQQFTEALASPGMPQKIKILLGEKGLEEVKRVQRVAENAIKTPAGARYNTSGSAIEMMNLLRRSTGVPFLGPWVTDPLAKAIPQHQAAAMAKTGPSAIGQSALNPEMEELLRMMRLRGAGLLSAGAGTAGAGELTR